MAGNELQMIIDAFRSGPKIADLSIEQQRAQMEVGSHAVPTSNGRTL